jgi:uncharacterized glyoxalase superfamily protein PhnB
MPTAGNIRSYHVVDAPPETVNYTATLSSPVAVGLRVADLRRAAAFYQQIGFAHVMAVPDENDEWVLCLLRFGNGSILLGALDHPRFPRTSNRGAPTEVREPGARVDLEVPDLPATYAACVAACCQITAEPAQVSWSDCAFSCLDPFGYEWQFTQPAEQVGVRPARTGHGDRALGACRCATGAALFRQ